ncbi:uncharacterized protein BX664DRAFT_383561 [Halteromyces radiatus]|uniref:uncharacterized protein n=1 Tax=Halteromyces radiatus TaxID=101107 RepID=UPI00221FDD7C|nr:uncharacterized protein BX664DRAFT_383561 [Halteromyces radiatus]KAI8097256.1 hypothetical protein BX664DRAFT_383561 [Halteromyces radiatus]
MLVNTNTRIARLSVGAGTFDGHHITSACSTSETNTNSAIPTSPPLTKRRYRSCQSNCHTSNTSSSSSSSSSSTKNSKDSTDLKIGQRVSVSSLCAIGTIRFIGSTSFKPGLWIGIELDIVGSGKNDGSIKGVRYFTCPSETGLFILANKVTPLKESTSCSSSTLSAQPIVTPKKSLTSVPSTTRRTTKTPSTNDTKTPRQRCLSHDQQQQQPTCSTSKKKELSLSTKSPRPTKNLSTVSARKTAPQTTNTTTKKSSSTLPFSVSTKATTASRRKSATPALSSSSSSQRKSSPTTTSREPSRSTRMTMTPSTKKRNSTLSSKPDAPETLRKSKSTSTRKTVTSDELKKMHSLLEQSRLEKQRLSDEMNGKEAVWERLVTAKESYALKVQDMELEITRLQDSLHMSQQQSAHLESQLLQMKSPRTISPSSPSLDQQPLNGMMINAMEQQYIRRIEKLDRLVREWQQDAQDSHQQLQQQQRTYTSQIEQLRRDLAERDQATAAMERDYETAKHESTETIRQYEATMKQWTMERDMTIKLKDDEIQRLTHTVDELKSCHFLLPPSPNNEEDEEDDARNNMIDRNNNMYSSRRRLEQQLELTTMALDDIQQQQKATLMDNEQLREQLSHMHAVSGAADHQFQQLQKELSAEINDKRLLMEERDVALQGQLRMEEEHKDLLMTNTRLEHQLGQLTERLEQLQNQLDTTQQALTTSQTELTSLQQQWTILKEAHDTMEQDYGRLMDDMLDLEEQASSGDPNTSTMFMKNEISRLKQQLTKQQQKINDTDTQHRIKISQLHNDMAQLESVIEKKTFRISELEELYTMERNKYKTEQRQWQALILKDDKSSLSCSNMPISPISDTASVNTTSTSNTYRQEYPKNKNKNDGADLYCEICEVYGHDVIGCNTPMMVSSPLQQHESTMVYCVNCDVFDIHATTDCPNQNETF